MERCLTALDVVEGSAVPARAPTPPATTDRVSYDDSLRIATLSKPTCDNVVPLKGILKSSSARDDHQKVVCFSGPKVEERRDTSKPAEYPPGQQPHFVDDDDFCQRYRDPDAEIRAQRRARDECAYELMPSQQLQNETGDDEREKPKKPGYLGTYGVDCKEVPEYMRLQADAYEKVKELRRDVPEISPAAARVAEYPREPAPPVNECVNPPPDAAGPCTTREEDVSFSCPHVEPQLPCCVPDNNAE